MECSNIIPKKILNKGISLESIVGGKEYGWLYTDIIEIIDFIKKENKIILGGDVYKIKDGVIEITYDNWYCSSLATNEETIEISKKYIEKYYNQNGNDYIYSIVVK